MFAIVRAEQGSTLYTVLPFIGVLVIGGLVVLLSCIASAERAYTQRT